MPMIVCVHPHTAIRTVAHVLIRDCKVPVNTARRTSPGVGQGGVKPLLSEKQIEHDTGIKHFNKASFF